jgi:hypothetical protein
MRKTYSLSILLSAFFASSLSSAGTGVPLLGLTLGGKFPAIKQCKMNQVGSDKVMCWIAAPTRGKDGLLGQVNLPNSDTRPSWAAHGSFQVSTNGAGDLETLSVYGADLSKRQEIVNSIGARFGQSNHESTLANGDLYDSWNKGPVYITLLCSRRATCNVRFTSDDGNKKELARIAEVKAKNAARPASP